eukprot:m.14437 g.14437  ORF g.14437 m.14437 type:complete len:559 (+) comp10132_c0_seq1:309-1985(+)
MYCAVMSAFTNNLVRIGICLGFVAVAFVVLTITAPTNTVHQTSKRVFINTFNDRGARESEDVNANVFMRVAFTPGPNAKYCTTVNLDTTESNKSNLTAPSLPLLLHGFNMIIEVVAERVQCGYDLHKASLGKQPSKKHCAALVRVGPGGDTNRTARSDFECNPNLFLYNEFGGGECFCVPLATSDINCENVSNWIPTPASSLFRIVPPTLQELALGKLNLHLTKSKELQKLAESIPKLSGTQKMINNCRATPGLEPQFIWIRMPKTATTATQAQFLQPLTKERNLANPQQLGWPTPENKHWAGMDRTVCGCGDDDRMTAVTSGPCNVSAPSRPVDYFPATVAHMGYRRCVFKALSHRASVAGGPSPNPIVIMSARDPVDRLISAYNHGLTYGATRKCALSGHGQCQKWTSKRPPNVTIAAWFLEYVKVCYQSADNMYVQMLDPINGDLATALANLRDIAPNLVVVDVKNYERDSRILKAVLCTTKPELAAPLNTQNAIPYDNNTDKDELRRLVASDPTLRRSVAGDTVIYTALMRIHTNQMEVYDREFPTQAQGGSQK